MIDYKHKQSNEPHEPQGSISRDAFDARKQLLYYIKNEDERREFEEMVGYTAAFNTYTALMERVRRG